MGSVIICICHRRALSHGHIFQHGHLHIFVRCGRVAHEKVFAGVATDPWGLEQRGGRLSQKSQASQRCDLLEKAPPSLQAWTEQTSRPRATGSE